MLLKEQASKTLKNLSCQMFLENKLYRIRGNAVKQREAKGNLADALKDEEQAAHLLCQLCGRTFNLSPC